MAELYTAEDDVQLYTWQKSCIEEVVFNAALFLQNCDIKGDKKGEK